MPDANEPANNRDGYDESPAGLQRRWTLEVEAAEKAAKSFRDEAEAAVKAFHEKGLFFADVHTKESNLSGNPKIRARRRFADAADDVARVSADALERLLNTDLERDSDGYRRALHHAKSDWVRVGLGQIRFRYVVETEPTDPVIDPATGAELEPAGERKTFEDVECDYVHWGKYLYSPCDTWSDVRWQGYWLDLSREECRRQFGDALGSQVPMQTRSEGRSDEVAEGPWCRAKVLEIWSKEDRRVYHFAKGMKQILKVTEDTLGLPGFFPSPEPLIANGTTSKVEPKATYHVVKSRYEEAEELHKRIKRLVKMVRLSGAYDANNEGLEKLLDDAYDGKLVPVKNWASLVDKGGMQSAVAFLPLKETIDTILALSDRLVRVKMEIYEISGSSDIMRGQSAERATATTDRIKARAFGMRVQTEQDELARFASDAQRIRAAIIANHFDAATIVQRSNIETNTDPALVAQAVEMLKSDIAKYRIDVDAESLAMTDYDAVQQEGIAIMQATGEFFAKFGPVMQGSPQIGGFALELYQQMISGFRGSERYEGIIDRAVSQLKQMAAAPKPPPPPDPKAETEKIKAGAVQVKAQAEVMKAQAGIVKTQMDAAADRASFGERMAEMAAQRDMQAAIPGVALRSDEGA